MASVLRSRGLSAEILYPELPREFPETVYFRDDPQVALRRLLPELLSCMSEQIARVDCRLLGFSPNISDFRFIIALVRRLRSAGFDSHVVLGGHLATFSHKRLLSHYDCIDSIVRGEGEYTIAELTRRHAASALSSPAAALPIAARVNRALRAYGLPAPRPPREARSIGAVPAPSCLSARPAPSDPFAISAGCLMPPGPRRNTGTRWSAAARNWAGRLPRGPLVGSRPILTKNRFSYRTAFADEIFMIIMSAQSADNETRRLAILHRLRSEFTHAAIRAPARGAMQAISS